MESFVRRVTTAVDLGRAGACVVVVQADIILSTVHLAAVE